MSRKKSEVSPQTAPRISAEEARRQAKRIVDKILDKENPIGRRAILEGLKHPELLGRMSKEAGLRPMRSDPSFRLKLKSALEKGDRQKLIELFAEDLLKHPMTPGTENEVVQAFGPQTARKVLLEVAETLKGAPGKPPLIDVSDYPALAHRADSLRPVVEKVLQEHVARNPRAIRECLEFWSEQYPEPCRFLLRHEDSFSELLAAKELPKPAKKQATKAHIIADALAGREHGLTFSTSIERVRQGRRMLIQTPSDNSAN